MAQPLAERLRPKTLDDYIGQKHLVGQGAILRKMIDAGRISSFILWGPPGVGKTTLAQIIANKLETPFYTLSAVTSGVKDVRDVIEKAMSIVSLMPRNEISSRRKAATTTSLAAFTIQGIFPPLCKAS